MHSWRLSTCLTPIDPLEIKNKVAHFNPFISKDFPEFYIGSSYCFQELLLPLTMAAKSFDKLRRWEEPLLTASFLAFIYALIFR